jgi:hypothetical protein
MAAGRRVRLTTSPPSLSLLCRKCGSLDPPWRLTSLWASKACYRDSLARKADLTAICEPIVYRRCGNLDVSLPYGSPRPVTGIAWRVRLTSPPSVSRLCTEDVGASTSHNPMGLHSLLLYRTCDTVRPRNSVCLVTSARNPPARKLQVAFNWVTDVFVSWVRATSAPATQWRCEMRITRLPIREHGHRGVRLASLVCSEVQGTFSSGR